MTHTQTPTALTSAETVSALLGDDGQRWTDDSGLNLADLCEDAGARRETSTEPDQYDLARWLFGDGSAIVTAGGGWDIEGSAPFSWRGSESTTEVE